MNTWLMRRFSWYRQWQEYRYHNLVHYIIFACFALYDVYTVIQLQIAVTFYAAS